MYILVCIQIYCVSMVETPYMKHEGLYYWQCLLLKEQATVKKMDMSEVQKYEGWQET
jgi:hypothetical protein